MVDLTKTKEERENYIIDIYSSSEFYVVKYASGKEELFGKTEETRRELLEKLEKQFKTYSRKYRIYAERKEYFTIIRNIAFFGIVQLAFLVMEYNLSPNVINAYFDSLKVMFLNSIFGVYLIYNVVSNKYSFKEKLDKIKMINKFLKYKNELDVLLYISNSGEEITYSPVDLINIDDFNSLEEIYDFVEEAITDSREDLVNLNKFNSEEEIHNFVSGKIEKEKSKSFTYSLECE